MIETLRSFTESLPVALQWLGVMVAGGVLYVESEIAAAIGVISGVHPALAVLAGILGNLLVVTGLVLGTGAVRGRVSREPAQPASPKRVRLRRAFDRYGVAGVSLLGPSILPSHVTSVAMVSFGARPRTVLVWQAVAITVWGVAFGALATLGTDLLAVRG